MSDETAPPSHPPIWEKPRSSLKKLKERRGYSRDVEGNDWVRSMGLIEHWVLESGRGDEAIYVRDWTTKGRHW